MTITYSARDARARFYEVVRLARQGKTVTISYRGKPVAEVCPIAPKEHRPPRVKRHADPDAACYPSRP